MAELSQGEKLQALVREIMRSKITSDFTTANKIAENLLAGESRLTDGERYFRQVIFNKVTDDLIKWFAGNGLDNEIKSLQESVESLRRELAEVRKIAVQSADRRTVKKVIEVEEDAETGEVVSQKPTQQQGQLQGQRQEEKKTASAGAGAGRQEFNPEEIDISKVFYFGGKK
jgi:hypothetical protein